jgi:NAD(P)-dependent dehydrogenase (short-subunit alcohol dehydrogenase family)
MKSFDGKIAVITGAAGGIGRCLAERLVAAGASVVMADIDAAKLAQSKADICAERGVPASRIATQVCDVTKEESVQALADKAYAEFGAVHLLFNNAGVGLGEAQRKLWDLPTADWNWGMAVNFSGLVYGIRAFVPRMLAAGQEGVIINTLSNNGGLRTIPNTPIYAASKAAATSLTEALHQQLLKETGGRVRVAGLFPGPYVVNTGILASKKNRPDTFGGADAKGVAYSRMEDLVAATGLKMQLTEPDEVAQFALEGVQKGNFWMIPASADADEHVRQRTVCILERGTPTLAW